MPQTLRAPSRKFLLVKGVVILLPAGVGLVLLVLASLQSPAQTVGSNGPATQPKKIKDLEKKHFIVFSALSFKNQPDLTAQGMRKVQMLGAGLFYPGAVTSRPPAANDVRLIARRAAQRGSLAFLDFEQWKMAGVSDEVLRRHERYLGEIADIMHETSPGLRLGYYGIMPVRDYWTPVNADPQELSQWHATNRKLSSLARHVDVIFPSLYTFYDDPKGWRKYAIANLKEARQYGKQVYAFIWFEYHPSNDKLRGKQLDGKFWRLELETCYKYADGVVIWGGHGEKWDPHAPWWQQTKQFLQKLRN